jgi:ribonuclease BN (tRNA processing enzyme)
MTGMKLTVVGCGDAFGSGGRLQSAYLLDTDAGSVLIDCGATVTTGLARLGRDANTISTIVISHLHGDHFGGLVWIFVQALYSAKRTAPLTVFGPPGIEARFLAAAEVLFPGCTGVPRRFQLRFEEMPTGATVETGPLTTTTYLVEHPSGAPTHALRCVRKNRTFAFSADSRWCDAIVEAGAGADLFLIECYKYDTRAGYHMAWTDIAPNLARIRAGRLLLTHMSDEMLANRANLACDGVLFAEDGMVLDI